MASDTKNSTAKSRCDWFSQHSSWLFVLVFSFVSLFFCSFGLLWNAHLGVLLDNGYPSSSSTTTTATSSEEEGNKKFDPQYCALDENFSLQSTQDEFIQFYTYFLIYGSVDPETNDCKSKTLPYDDELVWDSFSGLHDAGSFLIVGNITSAVMLVTVIVITIFEGRFPRCRAVPQIVLIIMSIALGILSLEGWRRAFKDDVIDNYSSSDYFVGALNSWKFSILYAAVVSQGVALVGSIFLCHNACKKAAEEREKANPFGQTKRRDSKLYKPTQLDLEETPVGIAQPQQLVSNPILEQEVCRQQLKIRQLELGLKQAMEEIRKLKKQNKKNKDTKNNTQELQPAAATEVAHGLFVRRAQRRKSTIPKARAWED